MINFNKNVRMPNQKDDWAGIRQALFNILRNIGETTVEVSDIVLADGTIIVGNSSGVGQARTMAGDVTITDAGVSAIGAGKVITSKILDAAVTLAKMESRNQATFIGRKAGAGAGVPQELNGADAAAIINGFAPAVFLPAEQGEDGQIGPPGKDGVTGAQGPMGPSIFLTAEDGEDGPVGMMPVDPSQLTQPGFYAHRNGTNQTGVATSPTFTKIKFTTEGWDTGGYFEHDADDSGGATESRFTPKVPGKYLFVGNVSYQSLNNDKAAMAVLRKNGADAFYGVFVSTGGTAAGAGLFHISAIIDMNGSTDYVELFAYHESGGNLTVNGSAVHTYFMGMRLSVQ